ncbi:alkaline phosphatase D family protein [Streptomyces sp. XD-27]|uniref:alkaline phosphatase D family protein n=1 Tax=Streptomyces sp. XD-27 TaxID=3062779 RepID=UPI0026F475BB|nr:alkaline phosphatase D family protein [Streptomyces sp. XD-27]WKX74199.1 alkaline phosphatase D family protein [Streptomyces sp. XD-27]
MAGLRLGPLLRHVEADAGGGTATVWVEADRPCLAEVACADGAGGSARTWRIAGHHYALIIVTGLRPDTETAYRVLLDGEQVWPLPGSEFPDSTIRTPSPDPAPDRPVRVVFGSCRWAAPPSDPGRPDDRGQGPIGPDALDTLASAIAHDPAAERPDVLVLLGDQVYADETSEETRRWLAGRRDLSEPPGPQVADYEEYTRLYDESWLDPKVRWLLSTVPSCMIFDDHDVIDDWNTSTAWLDRMRATPWWRERILSGLMSYWVYQHLGNLSPAELAADKLYRAVCETVGEKGDKTGAGDGVGDGMGDGTELLREFAEEVDMDPAHARWSYRRDFGRIRLVMVDSRAARVLDEDARAMLRPDEFAWLRRQVLEPGACDHLLIGTSLPWLLPHFVHDVERWNAAVCGGARGRRWARWGEALRQRGDLEHWAAFPASFDALTELIAEAGAGPGAPATISVLSGDVHHAYVAEPDWSNFPRPPRSRVRQLTCSPVHNSIPASIRYGFRFGWSRVGRWVGRAFARHGRLRPTGLRWRRTGGPWFGNQLMTLTLAGRGGQVRLDQARAAADGRDRLVTVLREDWPEAT